jgi:hypothetical protein
MVVEVTFCAQVLREMKARYCQHVVAIFFLCCTLFFGGCGGPYDSTVQGVVRLDGVAVPRGTVAFNPVEGGPAAYARIESDGSYQVSTGREKGLPDGEYEVTVTSNERASNPQPTGGPPPPGKAITPLWYRSKATSGLRFTVNPGENTIDLELSTTRPRGRK